MCVHTTRNQFETLAQGVLRSSRLGLLYLQPSLLTMSLLVQVPDCPRLAPAAAAAVFTRLEGFRESADGMAQSEQKLHSIASASIGSGKPELF